MYRLKSFLRYILQHPYITIPSGLTLAYIGYSECGIYHQCSDNSWPRVAEFLGLGLAITGTVATIFWALYKIIEYFTNK